MRLAKYSVRAIGGKNDGFGPITVGIFLHAADSELQIGAYERNYATMFDTFYPFLSGDRELALYSRHYTATRVMELPSCKDIGGEEAFSGGFCPTAYYVPAYLPLDNGDQEHVRDEEELKKWTHAFKLDVAGLLRLRMWWPFGFVAGCHWGDDSSWKIQYLDLSQVEYGIIRRDDRFGNVELLESMELPAAIEVAGRTLDGLGLDVAVTGKRWTSGDGRPTRVGSERRPE